MTQIGCDYGTVLHMCKDAKKSNTLNSRIVVNATVNPTRLYERDLSETGQEISATANNSLPTMFASPPTESKDLDQPADNVDPEVPPKKGFFGRIQGWFNEK